MRFAAAALAAMAIVMPLQSASAKPQASLAGVLGGFANYNALTGQPLPGSDGAVAQGLSDRMFSSLSNVLGGDAPKLNFVGSVNDPAGEAHLSATPAKNTVNVDTQALAWLLNEQSPFHSSAVNGLPHEMAHLRQTPQVLASVPNREGGAQAFADLVTPFAASHAGVHYITAPYDGAYADYVTQAQQRGLSWLLGGQFGRAAPSTWP